MYCHMGDMNVFTCIGLAYKNIKKIEERGYPAIGSEDRGFFSFILFEHLNSNRHLEILPEWFIFFDLKLKNPKTIITLEKHVTIERYWFDVDCCCCCCREQSRNYNE
jgi:hypothetical protein